MNPHPTPPEAKPIPPKEKVLIALMFPILGILFGGIYSYPAGRLTKERDPWFTLLLAAGLAITVFGVGYAIHAPHLGMVWLASIVLLLLVRAVFGLRRNFEHFGLVHAATLLILLGVMVITSIPKRLSAHARKRQSIVLQDPTKPGAIMLRALPHQGTINGMKLHIHGHIEGTATISGGTYFAPRPVSGEVDLDTTAVCYEPSFEFRYVPKDVTSGHLTIDYEFHDM